MTFHIAVKKDGSSRLQALQGAGQTAGAQRVLALKALKSLGSTHAFTLSYGQGVANVSGEGVLLTGKAAVLSEDGSIVEPAVVAPAEGRTFINPALREAALIGSAGLNKVVDGMPIPYGVCVIVAGSGAGKTPLAHYLAGSGVDSYGIVRVGEPFAGYTTNVGEAAAGIGCAAVAFSDVVVDSIKDLLAQGGAAMKGGIARSALSDLSFWSILGATLGVTFYVPLNPSSGDEETIKMLIEVAKSNTSLTVSRVGEGDVWNFSARPGEGLDRISGTISGPRRSQGPVAVEPRSIDLVSNRDPAELGRDIFNGAMTRAVSL